MISSIRAAVEAITGFNESVSFFQWLRSLQSRSNGAENQELREDDVLNLQNSLKCLETTLPVMHDLTDRAEWKSHDKCVKELLPELKDAVCDAEDIVEVFRYYELKVKIEGSATSMEPGSKFFSNVIQGNSKKLNQIRERLDILSILLERFGLHQATPRFDRSVRPETTRFPIEEKIFGRDDEIKELLSRLGVPASNRTPRPKRKRSAVCSSANEATTTSVPVLPIVGIGGVGKTTLAQNICNHPQVKAHFDMIIWICVSDDFDVKRLTKEAIEQCCGEASTKDNLDSLQVDLAGGLNKRRFLVVLDDVWAENRELWKKFYAPFKNVLEGSRMIVTTRSEKVANIVRTMDPIPLEGLEDNVFQNFFKLCVFGSDSSNNSPELESIGEQILPKLKGSPLAAKTLGRLLGMSFDPAHWNMILNSQLWAHKQEDTEIMPALRLSYIYLPFHLKRCFSFCAVYPKDYNFVKEDLAEIWVAEGFVEPQTGCKYFEELEHLSFFQKQKHSGKYVMHDLIHDMAQLVSKEECFIIKEKKDLERIPHQVRHLSVLKSSDLEWSDLESLCKQTKLRTLLCDRSLKGNKGSNVMVRWCAELLCMRVMVCASISKSGLPDGISNMISLRYLKIFDACLFDSLPATFCHLYNLQLLSARKCSIKVIPKGFSNLINLQKIEYQALKIDAGLANNFNLITRDLSLCNLYEINKDQAAKIELMKKKNTFNLTLDWSKEIYLSPGPQMHNEREMFEALQPPTNIKSLELYYYPGEDLPSWFHGCDDPTSFSSLTKIKVKRCPRLSCLTFNSEKFPLLTDLTIHHCSELETLNGGWPILKNLSIQCCPRLNLENGIVLPSSLQKLYLHSCGSFSARCLENLTSLKSLLISKFKHIQYIPGNLWSSNLKSLQELNIFYCEDLVSIGGSEAIAHIPKVQIVCCPKLKEVKSCLYWTIG